MSKVKRFIIKSVLMLLLGFILGLSYRYAFKPFLQSVIRRSEKVHCLKLEQQSKEFNNFFISSEENEMCKSYEISISAQIK